MPSIEGRSYSHITPEDGLISRNIPIVFLFYQFCDTRLEVPLISMKAGTLNNKRTICLTALHRLK